MLIRDGEVVAAGEKVTVPAGAVVRDLNGLHIWPALIEPYSDLGLPSSTPEERKAENKAARHWNAALRADASAHELYKADADQGIEAARARLRFGHRASHGRHRARHICGHRAQ
ncbi:MAG: hypothetical protein IPK70_17310 [Flavobacteriales bacterium]|nr:hypothetical protein [Flavobacteriales bacterium]